MSDTHFLDDQPALRLDGGDHEDATSTHVSLEGASPESEALVELADVSNRLAS